MRALRRLSKVHALHLEQLLTSAHCLRLCQCRFSIVQGNRVKWLGWELYVGYLPHYGPRYMDVRFKGERIAYEISMQEALACEHTAAAAAGQAT
jgi:Cu2+-containing amine oxidase